MGFQNIFGHRQKIGFGALSGPPAPVYGPYTIAFSAVVVSRGGVVTNAEKARLTTFETSLGTDILEFDRLWIHGLSNSVAALTSFVNPSTLTAIAVNAPVFTPSIGFLGNGSTSYLNSNYNPDINGVKYTLNQSCMFTYVQENTVQFGCAVGAYTSPFSASVLYPQYSPLIGLYYVNNWTPDGIMNQNSKGLTSIRRINSNTIESYKNGIISGADIRPSTGVPQTNMYILAQSSTGIAGALYNATVSATGFSSGNYNQLNFYNTLQALATSLGWAV
jgi:hypothetical protein